MSPRARLSWVAAFGAAVCLPGQLAAAPSHSLGEITILASPAGDRSGEPCLAVAPDGAVWMSWLERQGTRFALRVSRLEKGQWTARRTVTVSESLFVNWADTPRLAPLGGDRLAIAWPRKRGGGDGHAYDLRAAFSQDGGATWTSPVTIHRDGTATEHGFVSLVPAGNGVELVWLDGRKYAAKKPAKSKEASHGHGSGEMTVRGARLTATGFLAREVEIDPRACDCCNTAAVAVPGGVLIAYRDRDDKEIRDISVARLVGGRWGTPTSLHVDGWETPGCPVNGPALEAAGTRVVAAWFAMVGAQPQVKAAFSTDGGRSFGPPVTVTSEDPLGRVDVSLLPDGSALVCWLEAKGAAALVRVQRLSDAGVQGEPITVARTTAARASGFPQMVVSGDRAVFAWTDAESVTRVRTAFVRLP